LSSLLFDPGNDLSQEGLPETAAPKIRMNGDIINLNLLTYLPENNIADNLASWLMDNNPGVRNGPILNFSAEGALMPGIGKRKFLNGQNRR